MKTLLRWLALVLTLIVARVLLAMVILGGVLFVIGTGLNAAGLRLPTVQEIEQRLQPALRELQPLVVRIRDAVQPPAPANSAPASAPR